MYKVTLSMPIYNVAPYVERALLSALNQTFDSIEFLLVDDRGTDNSMEIVRRIIKDHPRGKDVRIIEHPYNIGTGATKNAAIDSAQGEYLFFMDSDDEITPDCIQVLYDKMKEVNVDFVVASYDDKLLNGTIQESIHYKDKLIKGEYELANYIFSQRGNFHIQLWNKMYDIQFLKKNNIRSLPSHLCEDYYVFSDIAFLSTSCQLINNVTLFYLLRDDSTTGLLRNSKVSLRQLKESLESLEHHYSYLNSIKSKSLYVGYTRFLVNNCFGVLCKIIKSKNIECENKNELHYKLNGLVEFLNVYKYSYRNDLKTIVKYVILRFPYYMQRLLIK